MKLTGSTNDQLMAMAAHRYCLGRTSYIVGSCNEWLMATWDDFEPNTRNTMVRDTVEAIARGCAGHEYDSAGWERFVEWAWPRLDDAGRDWLIHSVGHIRDDWPEFFQWLVSDEHLKTGE